MAGNKAVVYKGPGRVAVENTDYPELVLKAGPGVPKINEGRKCQHGVILKVVASNICGSDQHMVRGRTTAPAGLVLGHEITGEVIEKGSDVEFTNVCRTYALRAGFSVAPRLDRWRAFAP